MNDRVLQIDGVHVPRFVYGTAWKEDATAGLTELALRQGFRGIDTANQRKHYFEEAVGQGIAKAVAAGVVARKDLFLQTKFTFQRGQDDRLPYDPKAPIGEQVKQSFASSLQHLQTDHLDSYVLHGPSVGVGLAADDWAAWRAMEEIAQSSRTRVLGISNVSLDQLKLLWAEARIKPRFVQNRCYASRGWDRGVRELCHTYGIVYQGFSLLTANPGVAQHQTTLHIAHDLGRPVSQIMFRFALELGILPLTGTKSADHMRSDLGVFDFKLAPKDVQAIAAIGGGA